MMLNKFNQNTKDVARIPIKDEGDFDGAIEVKEGLNSRFKATEGAFNIETGEFTSKLDNKWFSDDFIDVLKEYYDTANNLIKEANKTRKPGTEWDLLITSNDFMQNDIF